MEVEKVEEESQVFGKMKSEITPKEKVVRLEVKTLEKPKKKK